MLLVLDKGKSRRQQERERVERLHAQTQRAVNVAFRQYVAQASAPPGFADLWAAGQIDLIGELLDRPIATFANATVSAFIDAGSATTAALGRKLVQKADKPEVTLSFNVTDPRTVALMQRNRLLWVQGLTRSAKTSVRAALVAGVRQGLGLREVARQFRHAIGLTERQQRDLRVFADGQRQLRADDLDMPEAQRGPIFSDAHIDRLVDQRAEQDIRRRAERIARTEATRIVGQAQDEALRQSLEAVGQPKQLTGKEWQSRHDGRTRDAHSERDGTRRRLDQAFAPGIHKPGDGPPQEAINCRCVLTYEFFSTEAELAAWLAGGT